MKYAIIIAMLAGSAMGQVSVVRYPDGYSPIFYTNTVATNTLEIRQPNITHYQTKGVQVSDSAIASAITNGTVCRVRGGHLWNDKWSGRERGWQSDGRQCQICNLYQKRKEVWEDQQ
jgi:hypothetical protein